MVKTGKITKKMSQDTKKMSTTICQLYIIPPPNKKLLDKMKNVKGKERTLVQSDVEMLRHLVSLLSR